MYKRADLITNGICKLRNQTIRGEISTTDFWNGYKNLKQHGLEQICEEAREKYLATIEMANKGMNTEDESEVYKEGEN